MAIMNKLTGAFSASIVYITIGTLLSVWTLVWLIFDVPVSGQSYFWPMGFLVTGLSVLAIGLLLGRIGRAASKAVLPPAEVTQAVVTAEQIAAARPVVLPATPATNTAVQPGTELIQQAPVTN